MAQGDFTRINTNIGALNALNSLKSINTQMGVRQLRLATGKRINEAAEDPAGLTIATKFKYRASGLGTALDNIGDAKNLMAVAEGGLSKINDILLQVRDKTLQAANDALGADERTAIKGQIDSFLTQIDNIVAETKWNGDQLIGSIFTKSFQTGADAGEKTDFTSKSYDSTELGVKVQNTVGSRTVGGLGSATAINAVAVVGTELESGDYTVEFTGATATKTATLKLGSTVIATDTADRTNATSWVTGKGITVAIGAAPTTTASFSYVATDRVASNRNANEYLTAVNSAIKGVSKAISDIGSLTARLSFKEETLSVAKVNTEAAHNRIMNADMAYEQLESTKLGILQQTATAMLSQANQGPQSILSLFR